MTSLTFKTQNSTYIIQKECNNYKTTAAALLEKRRRYRIPKYEFMPTHDKLTMRINTFLEYVASSDEILTIKIEDYNVKVIISTFFIEENRLFVAGFVDDFIRTYSMGTSYIKEYDDVTFNEFCEEFPGLSTPFTYSTRDEILAKTVGGDMESAVSLLNEW